MIRDLPVNHEHESEAKEIPGFQEIELMNLTSPSSKLMSPGRDSQRQAVQIDLLQNMTGEEKKERTRMKERDGAPG